MTITLEIPTLIHAIFWGTLAGMVLWAIMNLCGAAFLKLTEVSRPWTKWLEDIATKQR